MLLFDAEPTISIHHLFRITSQRCSGSLMIKVQLFGLWAKELGIHLEGTSTDGPLIVSITGLEASMTDRYGFIVQLVELLDS